MMRRAEPLSANKDGAIMKAMFYEAFQRAPTIETLPDPSRMLGKQRLRRLKIVVF